MNLISVPLGARIPSLQIVNFQMYLMLINFLYIEEGKITEKEKRSSSHYQAEGWKSKILIREKIGRILFAYN